MFRRVTSAAIVGIDVYPVQVEVDVSDGLPSFNMVGYVSAQVREAQDRVRTALKNSGVFFPPKRITVNLAPGDLRKDGSGFDLPIAAAILSAVERVPEHSLEGAFLVGELGLNGEIRPVPGVLPMVAEAVKNGCSLCIVPEGNLSEARVITEMRSIGIGNLKELINLLCNRVRGKKKDIIEQEKGIEQESETKQKKEIVWGNETKQKKEIERENESEEGKEERQGNTIKQGRFMKQRDVLTDTEEAEYDMDFADIHGQERAKRAALIAVAGFHNLLMTGPPGTGKTMIAKRIPTILPPMTKEECLEVSCIYSVAGLLSEKQPLMKRRPFCTPHHTATPQSLAGGGLMPRPGLVSLSHRGCLFIDEMAEFSRRSLEVLREPLEERKITISRASGIYTFPSEFILVAAMNPCPCGYYPDLNRCMCTPFDIKQYRSKISFPLLDRIDLYTEVSAVSFEDLQKKEKETVTSAMMRAQVAVARKAQRRRYEKERFLFNSELPPAKLDQYCQMTQGAGDLLKKVYQKKNLSARVYHRIIRIARTIADLDGKEMIDVAHVSEAVYYRGLDRRSWTEVR